VRRIPVTDRVAALLASRPRIHAWVFTNAKTERPYTTIRRVFERALKRADITTGDVTVHTLRHTALSRMIEHGLDDYTVMSISGHSFTRMLERYTHRPSSDASRRWRRSICPQDVHKTLYSKKRQPKLPLLLRNLVDGRRLELPTSALRTRRSPN
jgi:integrase